MESIEEKNKWYKNIIELFELQDFLSVIERDEKGNPIKVSGVSENSPNRLRIAENENDFQEIYIREFSKFDVSENNKNEFSKDLIVHIENLIENHIKILEYDKRNHKCVNIARGFVKYLKSEISTSQTRNSNSNILEWNGTQTEFIELTKALIENGNLKGTQKDIIKTFSNVFNLDIKNPNKLIQDIKNRNLGSETLFLDRLKGSLYDCIKK